MIYFKEIYFEILWTEETLTDEKTQPRRRETIFNNDQVMMMMIINMAELIGVIICIYCLSILTTSPVWVAVLWWLAGFVVVQRQYCAYINEGRRLMDRTWRIDCRLGGWYEDYKKADITGNLEAILSWRWDSDDIWLLDGYIWTIDRSKQVLCVIVVGFEFIWRLSNGERTAESDPNITFN